jgi:alpha-galactosidase
VTTADPHSVRTDLFSGPPRINSARRVGVRPGTELIHPLAVTGTRPLRHKVRGLPGGVTVDDDGVLRGTVPSAPGSWILDVKAKNDDGVATTQVELVVGDTLALTPPMGWNSWNVFRAEVNAEVIVRVAEAVVASGMRDVGYSYINIDDHWHAPERAADGSPVADPERFPDGIAAVADRVHALGLKLGIYSDAGDKTCGGCFGGYGHEEVDARTYAQWGVDLLKYDYCYAPARRREAVPRYKAMGDALAAVDRSIVFSVCEWGFRKPWEWAADVGGAYWRTTGDIFDSFSWSPIGVRGIAWRNMRHAAYAGPGRWNDPDMLLIGNRGNGLSTGALQPVEGWRFRPKLRDFRGLNDAQARSHMTLWVMMAAPLLASHDPATISEFDLGLLTNPDVLAVNQDPLGVQARREPSPTGTWVLRKPLADGSTAVSVTNLVRRPRTVTADLGIPAGRTVEATDAWSGERSSTATLKELRLDGHDSTLLVVDAVD